MSVRLNYEDLRQARARLDQTFEAGRVPISPFQAYLLSLSDEVPVFGLTQKMIEEFERKPGEIPQKP